MKIAPRCLFLAAFLSLNFPANSQTQNLKIWYTQPADASAEDMIWDYQYNADTVKVKSLGNRWTDDPEWLKALPLGNGSLGAMVFGDVNRERIQLNEESMWSGSPSENDNPAAAAALPEIRALLFAGKYREASELTKTTQISVGEGSGHGNGARDPFGSFQTLGDLRIDLGKNTTYSDYHRELDLEKAVVRVSYAQDGVKYQREIFTSHPDQAMVAKFTADKPGQLSFTCKLSRPERYRTRTEGQQLVMVGTLGDGKGGDNLQYMARLTAVSQGGKTTYTDSTLTVENADEVVLFLTASTDYQLKYPDYKGRDYERITRENLAKATRKSYAQLLQNHTQDYARYFDRVSLDLGTSEKDLPTDVRLENYKTTKSDPQLTELLFQYGRYLLISSSRPGTLPANLQGLWTNKLQTAWNGDYHTDINIQMNYWPAEVTNLSEIHLPYFDLLESLTEPGSQTAKVQYQMDGWVSHPITNVWGFTAPGEAYQWGMHVGAAAWLISHVGEHYAFTGDRKFIERMYPTMESAVQFYLDWLVEDPKSGKLVSGPAVSPENSFTAPDGYKSYISMGPAHDQQVIWQLFHDFIEVSKDLNIKDDLVEKVVSAQQKLAGPKIGRDGRLMEWAEEFPEPEPGHRHISHLFAVHPGKQINRHTTPELAAAARKSLDYRIANGGGHTGWSAAWLISQYARLGDAENALKNLQTVISRSTAPNLFGLHPPFQMDANFGLTAGIAEMLIQSHAGELELLPALPAAWKEGSVEGLCARGGFVVDMEWEDGQLTDARIFSQSGGACKIRVNGESRSLETEAGASYDLDDFE